MSIQQYVCYSQETVNGWDYWPWAVAGFIFLVAFFWFLWWAEP